jgi:GTPase SAR1 family protein
MRITIVNSEKNEKRYTRMELDGFVAQLKDGTFFQQNPHNIKKEVCFAAEWVKQNNETKVKSVNMLVLLSLENLRDLTTVGEYRRLAVQLPYTLLCFIGHDGHSLHIVCPFTIVNPDAEAADPASESNHKDQRSKFKVLRPRSKRASSRQSLNNAFLKYHHIYSSQLGTPLSEQEPTLESACKVSYDPEPYYNPAAIALSVSAEPEDTPEYRSIQEDISDYNYPEEIPGLSVRESRMRRFHDCLDAAIEAHHDMEDDELFATAVLEQLADGCRQMGLPQAWCARVASFIPLLGGVVNRETIESIFKTAYLRNTLKTIPTKFTRPSALLAYKTEAYMKEHYTLRLNVMTGTPEYRPNATGHGFLPLDQAARNTMAIKALKAGVDSWDKDLARYIDSNLIPKYYPMEDYIRHLPKWDGQHDYVGEMARRVKTVNAYWEEDFHKWMLSMVAQWIGKDRQHGNAIVPLLIGPQGSGKTTFCRRLLPGWLQTYYNDRISMKNDNDIFLAMSGYALINIDEFDAMKKSQQPLLKYLLSKHDVKFRPPYGKTMEERRRFASFIATTNNLRPLVDPTGSRRFVCVYADDIDNTGIIHHDRLYAQLYAELQEGRRYWFDDDETARLISQNQDYQQVYDYGRMIELNYLSPEDTPDDAKFILVKDIMKRFEKEFPTFTIKKNTDKELGHKLTDMGYTYKKLNKGASYRMKEI